MPTPIAATTEVVDPAYEWNNSGPPLWHGNVGTDSPSTFSANVEYYTDNSGGTPVACSESHPCTSLSEGVAFGTLSNRPTTCTTGVGYFATDQGSWNVSGNAFGQGQLFVCGATNAWQAAYTPYCYPHPFITGGSCGAESPDGGVLGDGGTVPPTSSSGCGCRMSSATTNGPFIALALMGFALRRRKSRPARQVQ